MMIIMVTMTTTIMIDEVDDDDDDAVACIVDRRGEDLEESRQECLPHHDHHRLRLASRPFRSMICWCRQAAMVDRITSW